MSKKVLMIGLRSDSVDFEKWPQLSVEKLEAAFQQVLGELEDAGYDALWCLTDRGETAAQKVTEALTTQRPDFVMVGAGVRTDPDHFLLFEQVINLIHEHAPQAKIVFNTLPYDSVQAVERWA